MAPPPEKRQIPETPRNVPRTRNATVETNKANTVNTEKATPAKLVGKTPMKAPSNQKLVCRCPQKSKPDNPVTPAWKRKPPPSQSGIMAPMKIRRLIERLQQEKKALLAHSLRQAAEAMPPVD